jgi:hypothetical protein
LALERCWSGRAASEAPPAAPEPVGRALARVQAPVGRAPRRADRRAGAGECGRAQRNAAGGRPGRVVRAVSACQSERARHAVPWSPASAPTDVVAHPRAGQRRRSALWRARRSGRTQPQRRRRPCRRPRPRRRAGERRAAMATARPRAAPLWSPPVWPLGSRLRRSKRAGRPPCRSYSRPGRPQPGRRRCCGAVGQGWAMHGTSALETAPVRKVTPLPEANRAPTALRTAQEPARGVPAWRAGRGVCLAPLASGWWRVATLVLCQRARAS